MYLIFDLDGTLVDSRPGILFSLKQAVRQVFPDSKPDSLEFNIGAPVREMLKRALEKPSEQKLDKLEAAFRSVYDGEGWKMTQLFPGVTETLKVFQSHDISMYIVTNKPSHSTGKILSHLGLSPYFLEIVCPDSHQPQFKEKTESLNYLLDKNAMQGEHVIYVGDTLDDLLTADALNVPFIGVEYGYGSFRDSARPVHLVRTFPELLKDE